MLAETLVPHLTRFPLTRTLVVTHCLLSLLPLLICDWLLGGGSLYFLFLFFYFFVILLCSFKLIKTEVRPACTMSYGATMSAGSSVLQPRSSGRWALLPRMGKLCCQWHRSARAWQKEPQLGQEVVKPQERLRKGAGTTRCGSQGLPRSQHIIGGQSAIHKAVLWGGSSKT